MLIRLKMPAFKIPAFIKSGLIALMKMDPVDRCMAIACLISLGIATSLVLWKEPFVILTIATIIGSVLFIANVLVPLLANRLEESDEQG